jgi:hypothetical protein
MKPLNFIIIHQNFRSDFESTTFKKNDTELQTKSSINYTWYGIFPHLGKVQVLIRDNY